MCAEIVAHLLSPVTVCNAGDLQGGQLLTDARTLAYKGRPPGSAGEAVEV
jgi:hypothetical protein